MTASAHARLFPDQILRTKPLVDRHRALVEALDRLATARTSRAGHPVPEQLTAQVVTAATELATAIQPVIDQLPAVTAALRDAAYYRHLDAQECSSGRCRNDRTTQQALADAYTTALYAITS